MRGISRVLSERVAFGTLVAALFALLPSCPSSDQNGHNGATDHQ